MNWDRWIGNHNEEVVMRIKHFVHVSGCRVDLHKMLRPDLPGCFHTHPAWAIRIILKGGYVEEINHRDNNSLSTYERWELGHIGLVKPSFCHRIDRLIDGPSYSLWLRGRRNYDVELVGAGWELIKALKGSQDAQA